MITGMMSGIKRRRDPEAGIRGGGQETDQSKYFFILIKTQQREWYFMTEMSPF